MHIHIEDKRNMLALFISLNTNHLHIEKVKVSLKILPCETGIPSGIDCIVKSLISSWRKMVEKDGLVISNEN